jgi:hypothetical protein
MKLDWKDESFHTTPEETSFRYSIILGPTGRTAEIQIKKGAFEFCWQCGVNYWIDGHTRYTADFFRQRSARSASLAGLNFLKQIGFKPKANK